MLFDLIWTRQRSRWVHIGVAKGTPIGRVRDGGGALRAATHEVCVGRSTQTLDQGRTFPMKWG